jgi:molybdopterin biosynthesis enzyme
MMRPFESTISIEQALHILREAAVPLDRIERARLDDASGRVLATDVLASRDVPAFDRSAMDGYAVRAEDTRGASREHPVTLRVLGRVYAGETADEAISAGACIEIATGAPIPLGADAVVMVEDTQLAADAAPDAGGERAKGDAAGGDGTVAIRVLAEVRAQQHIVRRGADMKTGDVLMARGAHLTASRLGALAAIGVGEADVYARPVVAILPTGDELTALGTALPAAHVYDVNRYTLASVVRQHGGVPRVYPTVADNLDAVRDAIARVAAQSAARGQAAAGGTRKHAGSAHAASTAATSGTRAAAASAAAAATATAVTDDDDAADADAGDGGPVDLLVVTGGSSVGEHDLVIDILREQGEILFHGIAVKPGRPTALARIGRLLVLGMPGNPTSCLSNAYVLLVPLLRATARLPSYQPKIVRAMLSMTVESPRDRHQYMPVRLEDGRAIPTFKGSGEITSLSRADGYFEIPAHVGRIEVGIRVDVTLY